MITLEQFYKGRDKHYASELTPEIQANAVETLHRANLLLDKFTAANPKAVVNRGCHSGWRPPEVNASIPHAAPLSNHMTGKAIDIGDDDGQLDKWLMTGEGQSALAALYLWLESPTTTPGWSHVQTVPPHSGHRVFLP
jgi:hypothetical protein